MPRHPWLSTWDAPAGPSPHHQPLGIPGFCHSSWYLRLSHSLLSVLCVEPHGHCPHLQGSVRPPRCLTTPFLFCPGADRTFCCGMTSAREPLSPSCYLLPSLACQNIGRSMKLNIKRARHRGRQYEGQGLSPVVETPIQWTEHSSWSQDGEQREVGHGDTGMYLRTKGTP